MDNIKKLSKKDKTLLGLNIFGLLVGIASILLGLFADFGYTNSVSYAKYGGDAYTGIQNAAAQTANNVDELFDLFNMFFRCFAIIAGILITILFLKELLKTALKD